MSDKPRSRLRTNFSLQRDASSELSLSLSSDSSEHLVPSPNRVSPSSGFQWPSEPLRTGDVTNDSQQTVDNVNQHAADRISQADYAANTHTIPDPLHPDLSKPRLSTQVTAAMDGLEDQRRQELALDPKASAVPSAAFKPVLPTLQRSFSASTGRSAASENAGLNAASASFPSMLPGILQNTVLLPLSLIHALLPQQLLNTNNPCQEGLSASTMQVPMTSVNALMEACNAIEWIAKASLSLEADGNSRGISQQSQGQQQNDDETTMAHFDIFELVQKLADVVSGAAASRSIDLVLDLLPSLHGEPAPNQQHYRLGSCTVWADRSALNFLLMSCLSKIIHVAPVKSTVIVSSTLMEKDETFLSDASVPNTKLMIFTLGLQLILPPSYADIAGIDHALSEGSFTSLLDAFGARIVADKDGKDENNGNGPIETTSHSLRYAISVPVGKLPDIASSSKGQQDDVHHYGPNPEQLSTFISTLKGKQVALYSISSSPFAHKLDRILTNFGCNVSPVYLDGPEGSPKQSTHTAVALTSGRPTLVSYDSQLHARTLGSPGSSTAATDGAAVEAADIAVLDPVTGVPVTFHNPPPATPSGGQVGSKDATKAGRNGPEGYSGQTRAVPFSFVIIDDDIATLQKELLRIRSAVPLLKSALASSASPAPALSSTGKPSRPPLAHRTKSSPQIDRVQGLHPETRQSRSYDSPANAKLETVSEDHDSVTQTIIFFTSMKSYRAVRDTVQPIIDSASFRGDASPPEIMVLPKPAGIRRILTALYATEHKSVVQLPLQPIATSPLSPLAIHGKSWWAPQSSRMQDDDGFMTLTRNPTLSSETDPDTTPSTPWSPIDSGQMTQSTTPYQPPSSAVLPSGINLTKTTSPRSAGHRSYRSHDRPDGASEASTVGEPLGQPAKQGDSGAASAVEVDEATLTSRSAISTTASQSGVSAEALEYFSETAAKIGGSAASGMVIQSPDGRPAGIFFQPKASMSSTSLAGSKPSLSRGVSTNSIRRGSASGPIERHDSSAASAASVSGESTGRDRRLGHRSTSSTHSMRNFSDPFNARNSPVAGDKDGASSKIPPGQAVNTPTAYPSGSMFAPQVGIHSVLSGSRPPMATPLNSTSGQNSTMIPSARAQQHDEAKLEPSQAPDSPVVSAKNSADTTKTPPSKAPAASPVPKAANPLSPAAKRRALSKSSNKAVATPASQVADASKEPAVAAPTPAGRSSARQAFPTSVASPSDPKKPSAVPQAGFMIGMGFTSSAQRGRGPRKAPVREAVLPPIKVLIVEDNPINQRILSMFMGKKKIQYDVANNGREAVDKWKTGGYHLILMDIQLPVMDGISATKEIRKLERNANIGILPNTPPATADSHVIADTATSPPKGESAANNTLVHKGLMKYPVGGSLSTSPTKTGGAASSPRSALINGVGKDNERLIKKVAGGGSASNGINPFRASVIIVALTASVLSSDRVEALAAGCNDFLNKPVSLPWLNQKILEWGSMMYLMYSGLSSDDLSQNSASGGSLTGGKGGLDASSANKAQLHLGFGYGPAEKAKALANNLHLGDLKKKKKDKADAAAALGKPTSPLSDSSAPVQSPPT